MALGDPPRNMEISYQIKGKKNGQKTPRDEMKHAIQVMNEYFEDKRRGEIKICEEEVIR